MPLPTPLIDRLRQQFGPAAVQDILTAFGFDRLPTLRVNTIKSNDEAVMDAFRLEAIQFERVKGIPRAFVIKNRTSDELLENALTKNGHVYLQGLTSMLPPIILDPQPGEKILDICAAPGSKTTQMAAMVQAPSNSPINGGEPSGNVPPPFMEGVRGRLIAVEKNSIRVQKLRNTIEVQGASIIDAREADATLFHHEFPEAFDRILADVPCSAEGRIQLDEPRTYRYWSEKNIVAHAKLQRRLLRSAVACLKPGGTLVYSTCTLAPEENEGMIAWLLAEYPSMKPEPVTLPFPSRKAGKGSVLLPTKLYEGFFVAKMRKE